MSGPTLAETLAALVEVGLGALGVLVLVAAVGLAGRAERTRPWAWLRGRWLRRRWLARLDAGARGSGGPGLRPPSGPRHVHTRRQEMR